MDRDGSGDDNDDEDDDEGRGASGRRDDPMGAGVNPTPSHRAPRAEGRADPVVPESRGGDGRPGKERGNESFFVASIDFVVVALAAVPSDAFEADGGGGRRRLSPRCASEGTGPPCQGRSAIRVPRALDRRPLLRRGQFHVAVPPRDEPRRAVRDEGDDDRPRGPNAGDPELQRLLHKGEVSARLDELIATFRRRGGDLPRPDRSGDSKRDRGARRDGGRDDDDDGCVSSYASGTFGSGVLDGISIVSSKGTVMSRDEEAFGGSSPGGRAANEADRERARQLRAEKKSKKRQLLDTVNRTIDEGDEDVIRIAMVGDDAESGIVAEDPAKLRQEIARLEARLKQKKTQRLAKLNDIVDIDLNALFDRLVSDEAGDEANRIVDRLKDRVCGGANDFHRRIAPDADDDGGFEVEATKVRKSLFARHSDWVREREEKLRDARTHLESEAMHGVTGRPELSRAARSWRKAKESHDEAMRTGAQEEERRRRASDEWECASEERKWLKIEELRRRADERLKATVNADATDPEERRRRLEELPRPRRTRDAAVAGGDEGTDAGVCDRRADGLPSKSKIFLPTGGSAPKQKSKPADVVGGRFDGRFGCAVVTGTGWDIVPVVDGLFLVVDSDIVISLLNARRRFDFFLAPIIFVLHLF
ncbi:hypothetical protein ACHAWF_017805 [Thalassiosira exigua]